MKRKTMTAFVDVFSLLPNSDYSSFVAQSVPATASKRAWQGVGEHLKGAMKQVGNDVKPQEPRA